MALPSWLQGPDVLGAMRGGAALGLSARAQDQAAEEFAAHLALQHDQLNAQQAQHAATLAQAQARAAEALRQHNALEIYRQKNLEQQARLREEAIGRQEAAAAARDALEREKFDFQKSEAKNKAGISPEIQTITDPTTGEEHSAFRTGPNTYHLIPKTKDVTAKKLTEIEETDLKSKQKDITKRMMEAEKYGDTNAVATLVADLLKNKTAQSNLVMGAESPAAALTTTNAPVQFGGNAPIPGSKGKLTKEQALDYLQKANGDKDLARKLAINEGWTL